MSFLKGIPQFVLFIVVHQWRRSRVSTKDLPFCFYVRLVSNWNQNQFFSSDFYPQQ